MVAKKGEKRYTIKKKKEEEMRMVVNILQQWHTQIIDVIRLVLSCACGFVIGYERQERIRQRHMQGAGLRTHMLVALAAAALMFISKYGFMDVLWYGDNVRVDVSRVAAGIVSGVGFIGAGIIFVRKENIMGLTTAAGLMATAAVGMAIGAGMYVCGITLTILIIFIQEMNRLSLYQRAENQVVLIEWRERPGMVKEMFEWLNENEVSVSNARIMRQGRDQMQMRLDIEADRKKGTILFLEMQERFEDIIQIDF